MNYTCRLCHFDREHCQCAPTREVLLMASCHSMSFFIRCVLGLPLASYYEQWIQLFESADANR